MPRVLKFEYQPREAFVPFHSRSARFATMVCHRRAGKTVACINDLIAKATYTQKSHARYAYIAPFYKQARDVAWEYLKQFGKPVISGKPKESLLRIVLFNGAWITLYGADNPDAFRGMYFDGVVIDEYGDMRPKLWSENILPTLADRQGWAVFIGTPKGPNHFRDMYDRAGEEKNWFRFMLKASESGIIPAAELEMQKSEMDEDEYLQEYECSFTAAVRGTIFAQELNKWERNQNLRDIYDRQVPIQIAMDLGRKDAAAAWGWHESSDGVGIFHHHESSGTNPEYWDELWTTAGYKDNIEILWLPHDAVAKTFATKRSAIEQFRDLGYNVRIVPRLSVQDGIIATRSVIPICHFDESCYDGLQALYAYKRKWDDAKKVLSKDPDHDWASNSSDAFRYFGIVAANNYGQAIRTARNAQKERDKSTVRPMSMELEAPDWTLDDLWDDHDKAQKQQPLLRIN